LCLSSSDIDEDELVEGATEELLLLDPLFTFWFEFEFEL